MFWPASKKAAIGGASGSSGTGSRSGSSDMPPPRPLRAGSGVTVSGIRAVLFDKDGTLIDLHTAWVAAGLATARQLCDRSGQPQRFDSLVSEWGFDPGSGRLGLGLAGALLLLFLRNAPERLVRPDENLALGSGG